MKVYCTIELPAGYDVDAVVENGILSALWKVPGGGPCWCHVVMPPELTDSDWARMLADVQSYISTRGHPNRTPQVTKTSAVSDRPPPMETTHVIQEKRYSVLTGAKEPDGSYTLEPPADRTGSA